MPTQSTCVHSITILSENFYFKISPQRDCFLNILIHSFFIPHKKVFFVNLEGFKRSKGNSLPSLVSTLYNVCELNIFRRYKQGLNPPVSSMIYPSYDLSRFSKRSDEMLDPPLTRKPTSISLPWKMNLHSPMLRGR